MSNQRRNRRTAKGPRYTAMGKARARTRLAANVTEEHEWYLDTPDIRLTRIFTIVLLLHAVAFGGILAFKMVDKASANTAVTISSARPGYETAVQEEKELAAAVPSADAPAEDKARVRPPAPLRRDQNAENQYKVQAGDTLPEIAASLKIDAAALRRANSIISDNELYPGRWLKIPTPAEIAGYSAAAPVPAPAEAPARAKPAAATAAPVSAPAATTAATTAQPSVYEVKAGDTAWAIAQKLGVSYHDLMKVNGVDKPETLQIGQKLRVPGSN